MRDRILHLLGLTCLLTLIGLAAPGLADAGASFELSLEDRTEEAVWQGQTWTIQANVTNTGQARGVDDLTLTIHEPVADIATAEVRPGTASVEAVVEDVELAPGASETVELTPTIPEGFAPGRATATLATAHDVVRFDGIVGDTSVDIDPAVREGADDVVVRLQPLELTGIEAPETALKAHANLTQEELRELAEAEEALSIETTFWLMNGALVELDREAHGLALLSTVDHVTRIHENPQFEPLATNTGDGEPTTSSTSDTTWGLDEIDAPEAWAAYGTRGGGARIAVLDTGVDADHPDIDLYTEDPTDPTFPGGWAEFDQKGDRIVGSTPYDVNGHGTHVSGTVAGGDASGTHIGVAPGVDLLHGGVVTPQSQGTLTAVIAGMQWAAEQDADAASMSLGQSGYLSMFIEPIRASHALDTFVVASIGNDGAGTSSSPGNDVTSLAIGASDPNHDIASFSSGEQITTDQAWGDDAPRDWPATYIVPDVAAPGVNVYSAQPGGGYDFLHGTSMAAPHVSGTVGLLASAYEHLTVDHIEEALTASAWKPSGAPSGEDTRYGHGIIDAKAALDYADAHLTGFAVDILDRNTPVTAGQRLNATLSVENIGDQADTQTIRLSDLAGNTVDTRQELSLQPGQAATFNLSWTTSATDAGFGEVTARSEDLGDDEIVRVFDPAGGCQARHPLHIEGDWAFTKANGVTRGQGTAEDPYVIERWCITGEDMAGLSLFSTSAHVEVRANDLSGSQRGVSLWRAENVRIVDNTIDANDRYGISVSRSDGAHIEGNRIANNGRTGVSVWASSQHATVEGNEITGNAGHGVWLNATGHHLINNTIQNNTGQGIIGWSNNALATITENRIETNDERGILLAGRGEGLVEANTVRGNADDGISIWSGTPNNTVADNVLQGNGDHGIWVGSADNDVVSNTVENSTRQGITVSGDAIGTSLRDNEVRFNGLRGLRLSGNGQATVQNNTFANNTEDGISIWSGSDGNEVHGNTLAGNGDHGMWIGALGSEISQNTIEANAISGVHVSSGGDGTTIRDNQVRLNGKHGIYANATGTLVEANLVEANGWQGVIAWDEAYNTSILGNEIRSNDIRGILLSGHGRATVQNNTVEGNLEDGMSLRSGSQDNTVRDNRVAGNGEHGIWVGSLGNELVQNTIEANRYQGITVSGQAAGTLLRANEVRANEQRGILLAGDGEATVVDNTVRDNLDDGISMWSASDRNEVAANTIEDNGEHGIWVGSLENEVTGNTFQENAIDGVHVSSGADQNTVRDNQVRRNDKHGIFTDAAGTVVENNTVESNAWQGVIAWDDSSQTSVVGNEIRQNEIRGVLLAGSGGALVENNTIEDNLDDGVSMWSSSHANTVLDNRIDGNGDVGIWAGGSNHDIRRNTVTRTADVGVILSDGANDNTVRQNTIAENPYGIYVTENQGNEIVRNDIEDNEDYGLYASQLDEPLQAIYNWWGDRSGPDGDVDDCSTGTEADGDGDEIGTHNAAVCFDPWVPLFRVAIESTNDPVLEGDTLEVTANVENVDIQPRTQRVQLLDFEEQAVDGLGLTLDAGSSTTVELAWDTQRGDSGLDQVTVESKRDQDSQLVTILPNPLAP